MLRENVLEPGELLTRVVIPADAPQRSVYLKVREREAGDFALVSVAAALSLDGDGAGAVFGKVRIALGGVAPVPYRVAEVEDYLTGKAVAEVEPRGGRVIGFTQRHTAYPRTATRSPWPATLSGAPSVSY